MSEALERFLNMVASYRLPEQERTIFSLGGRGYYENAASDMLAFFFQPDAEHGFGDLFLSALFDCMKIKDAQTPQFVDLTIGREVKTKNQNRIDLQILGQDWCLIVENKIWHIKSNPFPDYETQAKALGKGRTFFAILSPDGESINTERYFWVGVKYSDYCAVLRQRLGAALFDYPHSKWHLFAREFILHIENELYPPPMNPDQVAFVEIHTDQFSDAQKLMSQYRLFVRDQFQTKMKTSVPEFSFEVREESWPGHIGAWRCRSPEWRANDMVITKREGAGQKFFGMVILGDASEPRLSKAKEILSPTGMNYGLDDYPIWTSSRGHDSANGAIEELCHIAQIAKTVLTM